MFKVCLEVGLKLFLFQEIENSFLIWKIELDGCL